MIELKADLSDKEWEKLHKEYPELVSQVVVIRHSEFPDGLWYLRFPEQIATSNDSQTGPYQTGMQWRQTAMGWHFQDCPLTKRDGNVEGTIAASQDSVNFSLKITNQSTETWNQTLAWLCFNHSHATKYYRNRNYIFQGSHRVQTPADQQEHYCLQGHDRNWWEKGSIVPTESLIATCCQDDEGTEFSLGIAARKAILLGQNPGWPCTDIALFFGDIPADHDATIDGKIYFRYGPPSEILKLYQKDYK